MSLINQPLPQELYFLRVDGRWRVYLEIDEGKAIRKFDNLTASEGAGRVRIWKSSEIEAHELELVRVKTRLVPKVVVEDV